MTTPSAACYPIRSARRLVTTLALAGLLLVGSGCLDQKTSDRDVMLIDSSAAESLQGGSRTLLGGRQNTVIVDPRPLYEWRQGHLDGALHLPLESLQSRPESLADADIVIVYGTGYRSPIAMAAAKTLRNLGLKDVRVLEGGLQGWERAGLAVIKK